MSNLEWLYANGKLSGEDFNMLEEVFAQKYKIDENSIFRYRRKNKQ